MSQSVKLTDGSYIDTEGVWDNTFKKTQSDINAALKDLIKIERTEVNTSGGDPTIVHAKDVEGYHFYRWISVSSIGFVGSPYFGDQSQIECRIFDKNYTNESCKYYADALYIKDI